MFDDALNLMPLWAFFAACGVTFLAGVIKGAIGFGLPLVMVSGMALFLDPLLAIAGVLLPALLSNVTQVFRFSWEEVRVTARAYWRYILITCVVILMVTQIVVAIPTQALQLALGIPVIGLSLIQLWGVVIRIPEGRRRAAEWVAGFFAGGIGGLTGSWGPPTVLYLMALETPKMKQILVQGIVYSLGAVSLIAGHLNSGVMTMATAPFSAALLVPTFIGMKIGIWICDRIDAEVFRKVTLVVLVIAGANLVRKGIFG